jgi:hypothetical protein
MRELLNMLILLTLMASCGEVTEEEEESSTAATFTACSLAAEQAGTCTRFMDRTIYLAFSDIATPDKNNAFHKEKIKDALNEITLNTSLGDNYFTFIEVDDSELSPILEETELEGEFKSFIQVFPDDEFNTLFSTFGTLPDPNAITVVNSANRRQFYIILRASCFESSEITCTNDGAAVFTTNKGLRALIGRQLGLMVGLTTKDCTLFPVQSACATFPSDAQWSDTEKDRYFSVFNNSLEAVSNNASFYELLVIE